MFDDTPLWMVEDDETLAEVAERLLRAPAIGVDTESDSFFSYKEKVCLLQISDLDTDYIIDPLSIDDMSALDEVMASREVVKIFHGADYDIVCMKRDFGYDIREIFDTMVASQLLGLDRLGLADLIHQFFGHEIEKKYQRHDWGRRPLGKEHIEYARGDSHFLPALREILLRRLRRARRLPHIREECEILEQREWTPRPFDEDRYLHIKTSKRLDDTGLRILKRLYLYREAQGERMDRPVFKVIGDKDLVRVAECRPTNRRELDKALPGKEGLKRRHADALVKCVVKGLEDDFPIPAAKPKKKKPKPKGFRSRLKGRLADKVHQALKDWRNNLVSTHARLTPVGTLSNAVLGQIAQRRPLSLREMRKLPDVRRWQVKDFGEDILAILDKEAPWTDRDEDRFQAKARKKKSA